MRFISLLSALAVACVAAPAFAAKVAMMPIAAGADVTDQTATTLTEQVAARVRQLPDVQVVTQQEIATLLSHEQQRQLLGCQEDACAANLGGALGADALVTGHLGRIGESFLFHLKLIDVKKAQTVRQADRRVRGGTLDDVLDQVSPMVAELFTPGALAMPEPPPATPKAAAPKSPPPGWAETPSDMSEARARLKLLTDGKGRYVAYDPQADSFSGVWAGDATKLFAQRIFGGGSEGDTAFDRFFWEPRVKQRWQAALDYRDGAYKLQCGNKSIPLTLVPEGEAKALVAKAQFFEPRWQRRAYALARNDDGVYYFADQAREPDDNTDFRLFIGTKGKLAWHELNDVLVDDDATVFILASGEKLRFPRGSKQAEWIVGQAKQPLSALAVEDQAAFIYSQLGVYKGEQLGSICDDRL